MAQGGGARGGLTGDAEVGILEGSRAASFAADRPGKRNATGHRVPFLPLSRLIQKFEGAAIPPSSADPERPAGVPGGRRKVAVA